MPDTITVVNMIPKSSSGETNQDSEPSLAVNPANPLEIAGTAFTPSPNAASPNSPVFFSIDGGHTWALKDIISGTPVRDQTLRFASSGNLYAGVLWGGGGLTTINFDILRTNDFSGSNTMTLLARRQNDDQPFIQAATVTSGPGTGDDRIYVGSNDHAPPNIPSTMDYSLNAAIAAATTKTQVLETRVVSRDGFQTRPAIHPNGTVYALYYALIGSPTSCDVVIVRDDNWASGASPFQALTDPGDSKAGLRIVTGINNPFLSLYIGQQRIGGDLSIAVDPNDSAKVYVCWGRSPGRNLHSACAQLHRFRSHLVSRGLENRHQRDESRAGRQRQRPSRLSLPARHRTRGRAALADHHRNYSQRFRLDHFTRTCQHSGRHTSQSVRSLPR
jgi:hypothetical protein